MKQHAFWLMAIATISIWSRNAALAQGSTVSIHLRNHSDLRGELLDVRDSVIIVRVSRFDRSEPDSFSARQISSILVHGDSRIPVAIASGAFLGTVAGTLTAQGVTTYSNMENRIVVSSQKDTEFYTKAGFALGAGLGWFFGWMISESDRKIDMPTPAQLTDLKTYSRQAKRR